MNKLTLIGLGMAMMLPAYGNALQITHDESTGMVTVTENDDLNPLLTYISANCFDQNLTILFANKEEIGIQALSEEKTEILCSSVTTLVMSFGSAKNDLTVDLQPVSLEDFSALKLTITKTGRGNDTIFGTPIKDIAYSYSGKDNFQGGKGNDEFYGGFGNDEAVGGPGNDILNGGPGNDHLRDGVGSDTITGGVGKDRLIGKSKRTKFRADSYDTVVK